MRTAQQLIAEAKAAVKEVSVAEVQQRQASGAEFTLIDVREQNEWNLGHIPGAIYIGRGVLEQNVDARVPRDAAVVLYCQSGNRSALAAKAMQEMGYTDVASMAGGIKEWAASGGDIAD